ncbi:hypothetical protein C0991_005167 [Blastosporella zonata]|nr:hypothetical protein C0991_005167 [Blastosporella zonata]
MEFSYLKASGNGSNILTTLWFVPFVLQSRKFTYARIQVINAGEALEFLSGRYYKGTIHRVRQPPLDQQGLTRLGVFFFALFNDDVKLIPLQQSPVLQRVGIVRRTEDNLAPNMGEYRKARIAAYGQTTLKAAKEKGVEEEQIAGVVVRHYN